MRPAVCPRQLGCNEPVFGSAKPHLTSPKSNKPNCYLDLPPAGAEPDPEN